MIIGAIGLIVVFVCGAILQYGSIEKTAERYRKAVEICGDGNVIQDGRDFDCEDFLKIK